MDEQTPAGHSIHAVNIFNKYAKQYHEKFRDVSLYHEALDLFCNNLGNSRAQVLELACGPGNITKYLLAQKPDLNILGTDLAPNMLEIAALINPKAHFELMDCRDLLKLEKKFDGIVCGFCMPYLSRTEATQLIHDAALALENNGVLYISTMEDDYSSSGLRRGSGGEEMYLHYHEADYLEKAITENKMQVISLERKTYKEPDGNTTTDLLIVAKKKLK